jgi:hypothetical protein
VTSASRERPPARGTEIRQTRRRRRGTRSSIGPLSALAWSLAHYHEKWPIRSAEPCPTSWMRGPLFRNEGAGPVKTRLIKGALRPVARNARCCYRRRPWSRRSLTVVL